MPENCGMAFVVVVHLSADHDSVLADILQRSTAMKVIKVVGLTEIEANSVYVIPPGHHLVVRDGHIDLKTIDQPRGRRMPVDLFFRSLADTHGPQAMAVVLSGGDGDGCIGIKRIKERGGLTIAQDPNEAEIPQMPRCSIATGMVDWVLPVREMPQRLMEYLESERRVRLPLEPELEQEEEEAKAQAPQGDAKLREVLAFLCMRTGHDFSAYKRATMLRRVARRMQVNSVTSLTEYLAFLRTHPGETGALLQDLLISVTNFFRDKESFERLNSSLPDLFEGKRSGDLVRVWVVACATGEEAYSVAMLMSEYADRLESKPTIQIFATDIDEEAISVARDGRYPETILADVSEERLRRFFTHEQGAYRIRREIREMVLFASHNVLKDSPFSRLDLITCRNLLIYLTREAQSRVFDIFHFALGQQGKLFLGSSESAEEARLLFGPVNKEHRIFEKKATGRLALPIFMSPHASFQSMHARMGEGPVIPQAATLIPLRSPARGETEEGGQFSWEGLHFKLLEGFVPPSVIVNSAYDIIHLSEGCGRFLQFSGGKTTVNLLHLVHPALRIELRAALFRASQGQETVQMRDVRMEVNGQRLLVDISVRPAKDRAVDFFLVVFEERAAASGEEEAPVAVQGVTHHLEQEIEHLKLQLRQTVEQYEASSEELKASNEELQAMNEELRSATEELETSREELQSINEEITTVNMELKSKVHELSYTNSDLQNLMASTHIATIFLDRQLCIKRYTPSAVKLFNLISTDVGRPLADLRHRLDYEGLTRDAEAVLDRLLPVSQEVCDRDGRWFLTQMQPYRTTEDQIAGVVLTFVDITETKQAQEALRRSEERLVAIFEQAAVGQSEIDPEGRFLRVNDELCRILGRTRAELLSLTVSDVTHPDDIEACMQAWTELLEGGNSLSIDKRYVRPDGSVVPASSSLSRLGDSGNQPSSVLAVTVDLTQRVEAAKALEISRREILNALHETRQAREAAEQADQVKNNFLAVLSHELRTPLTPVLMAVQAANEEPDLNEELKELFQMIERNILMETYLIDDLLDITRITRGKMEITPKRMDLHAAVKEAVNICQSELACKEHRVEVALEAAEHEVEGDSVRLQQVFWNLVKNACKFTPKKGSIRVRSYNEGGRIVVEVEDTGIGISAEALAHVFSPFTQADATIKKKFGGLGLGLAISQATVLAHEGTIHAASEGRGKGSCFVVTLPLMMEGK
ncbi:CheR family methyltransferase [Prosthecobacter sp. SYSU 5D2]|uniref:CheR family methyltransferase n=1 Tax=Prosthecobacter sp. SYSU 5D2 TaxID=3134134 RepID=UPI0031FEEB36